MSTMFDPYYKWLGIPTNEQPPSHYRLLGIRDFEPDLDVIEHATDRQMAHIRTFQIGTHSGHSQRILNEISLAKVVLLNPKKKSSYDTSLKQDLARQFPGNQSTPANTEPSAVEEFAISTAPRPHRTGRQPNALANPRILGGLGVVFVVIVGVITVAGFGKGEPEDIAKPNRGIAIENENTTTSVQEAKPPDSVSKRIDDDIKAPQPATQEEGLNQVFSFDDKTIAEQNWEWSGKWEMGNDGGTAARAAQSFLRTRNAYKGNVSISLDFSFGRAKFSNTGGCWITVWGQRLPITNGWRGMHLKVDIHRDGDEIVYVKNGEEQRILIDQAARSTPTAIEIRWRSRTSHFRRIQIKAQSMLPLGLKTE